MALVAGAVGCPLRLLAQTANPNRKIGILWHMAADDPTWRTRFEQFRERLRALGWTEGQNFSFDIRHAVGEPNRFVVFARELVAAKVDVICVTSAGLAEIARQATIRIPIITASAGDLEGSGLVASLRRPGGNVTGMQMLNPELMSKRVELLKELVPNLERIGLIEPITPGAIITERYLAVIKDTAKTLGIQVSQVPVRRPDEFAMAFAKLAREGVQAAIIIANPLSAAHRQEVISSAARARIVTMYEVRIFAVDGGLVSYGVEGGQLFRGAADYVDKILRGVPVTDLPVQQATTFELVINLKAAKLIGMTVPPSLLSRADEVIE